MDVVMVKTLVGGLVAGDLVVDSWLDRRLQMVVWVGGGEVVWVTGGRVWSEVDEGGVCGRVYCVLRRGGGGDE